MSKLTWLHISDLHFRAPQDHDFSIMREALLRDVSEFATKESLIPDFVFVTGDLAFAGQREEYDLVQEFLDKLLKATGISKDQLFIIPGNHDVDRGAITPGAASIVEALYTRDRVNEFLDSEEDRALVFRKFHHYKSFISDYFKDCPVLDKEPYKEPYFYVKHLELSGKHVAIMGLNSAWASGIAEGDRVYVLIGERQAREALEASKSADLKLVLMHHPPLYLSDSDQYYVQPLLLRYCNFVLHGHVPPGGPAAFLHPDVKAMVIGTGLGYKDPDYVDTYNFVQLDFDVNEGFIYPRRYDRRANSWTTDLSTYPETVEGIYKFPLRLDWSPLSEESADSTPVPGKVCVNELRLTDFRCFKEESFPFSEKFTVLIGDNASGKTTILDALAIGLGHFFSVIGGPQPPPFAHDDARLLRYRHGEMSTGESQYPVQIHCRVARGDQELEWTVKQEGRDKPTTVDDGESRELAKSLKSQVQNGSDVVLPLFACYNTDRLWEARHSSNDINTPGSRFRGYDNFLKPAPHAGDLMQWMKTQELIALQERKPSRVYEAVKDAIKDCLGNAILFSMGLEFQKDLEGGNLSERLREQFENNNLSLPQNVTIRVEEEHSRWVVNDEDGNIVYVIKKKDGSLNTYGIGNVETITYNVRADEVYARFIDGREFPFRMFSGGVRNMFGMVADIAYRAAILNPQFDEEAPSQTPGIVLIDEIDLHLHPSWQRRVVDDLRRTFPRIQFIATTHSPFIIQSLRSGELVDLQKNVTGEYVNRSIEDIIEGVMGIKVPQRSERFQQMYEVAEEYYKVLQEAEGASSEEKHKLEQRLDELTAPFSDDVAYHAFLEMERIAARGKDDDETS